MPYRKRERMSWHGYSMSLSLYDFETIFDNLSCMDSILKQLDWWLITSWRSSVVMSLYWEGGGMRCGGFGETIQISNIIYYETYNNLKRSI